MTEFFGEVLKLSAAQDNHPPRPPYFPIIIVIAPHKRCKVITGHTAFLFDTTSWMAIIHHAFCKTVYLFPSDHERCIMAKGMDRGNVGHSNKPQLSLKEKLKKRKEKKLAKKQSGATGQSV
jgi:hypothetical protein